MPQDEIIAVDGSRILETKQLQAYAKNHIGRKANFIISDRRYSIKNRRSIRKTAKIKRCKQRWEQTLERAIASKN